MKKLIEIRVVAVLVTIIVCTQAFAQNPETVWQSIVDAMNAHDVDKYLSYIADDIVFDSVPMPPPLNSKKEVGALVGSIFQAFPDFHITLDSVLTSGNVVVSEYIITGTHQGEWGGIPPTGTSSTRALPSHR